MNESETRTPAFPDNWIIAPDYDPSQHMIKYERRNSKTNQQESKDYLNVQNRLIWFVRDQRQLMQSGLAKCGYVIRNDLIHLDRDQGFAHYACFVRDVLGNEATMYGSETQHDFPDYIEKAGTKALGRTLAMLGYGTQFAPELDEGERLADAPVARSQPAPNRSKPQQQPDIRATKITRAAELAAKLGEAVGGLDNLSLDDIDALIRNYSQRLTAMQRQRKEAVAA